MGNQVEITVKIQGLEPNSVHAWHVHEYGDISSADGKARVDITTLKGMSILLPSNQSDMRVILATIKQMLKMLWKMK